MTAAERSAHSARRVQDALRHLSRAVDALNGAPTGRLDPLKHELASLQDRLAEQWGRERGHGR